MSHGYNKIISSAADWQALKAEISTLPKKEKGDVFELFTKYFLQSHPDYTSMLSHVWLFSELSPKKKQELKIPSNDQGIDLVAETKNGEYWAIQCKYVEDENQRLSHDYISTFGNLAFAISKKFSFGLVCTTAERFSKAYNVQDSISFCTSEIWRGLTQEQFDNIRNLAVAKPLILKPYKPFHHQARAIKNAIKHFVNNDERRGKLILPCGSGKSLTGFWIAEKLKAKSIIVAVPSLALVRQTLNTWLREAVANEIEVEWICVCSDDSIGKQDDVSVLVQDLGIPSVTDKNKIAKWLRKKTRKTKVVFTTYQSGEVIAEATQIANFSFNLGIFDEAHKTVGQKGKLFSHLIYDENISIQKRVFMTATERRYLGSSDEIASMDNIALYGETFELLTFKEALEVTPPILSDYRIITVAVREDEVRELIEKNAYVRPTKGIWNEKVEAQTITSIIALRKAMEEYPIKHAVSFHSSIARAKAFEENQIKITEVIPDFKPIDAFHVTGATPTAERSKTIQTFVRSPRALITNARCLTEGVDIPNIDCILFADPKKSTIDIVQAVGRALRVSKGKKYGYVIIPVLAHEKDGEQVINDDSYSDLLLTLRALASNDERIIEYFKLKSEGGLSKGKRFDIENLVEIHGENIDLQKLVNDIELRIWSRLAKLSWRSFEDARKFVKQMNFKNRTDWEDYIKAGTKPADIPFRPNKVYFNVGWQGWGDWLGNANQKFTKQDFMPFVKASSFVKSLKLKNSEQWRKYCASGNKPDFIPSNPQYRYKHEGWKGLGDWLGTGRVASHKRRYHNFRVARKFVQKLRLTSWKEWIKYCKSGKLPILIPANPNKIYRNKGWKNFGDWLGTGVIATNFRKYKSFNFAKKFARSLKLKNHIQWLQYCKLGKKPNDIPSAPNHQYKKAGWIGWKDWLGTNSIASKFK